LLLLGMMMPLIGHLLHITITFQHLRAFPCQMSPQLAQVMSPLNFFKGSFFDHAFKAKPAPSHYSWVPWE
jgi:hypothetical protein